MSAADKTVDPWVQLEQWQSDLDNVVGFRDLLSRFVKILAEEVKVFTFDAFDIGQNGKLERITLAESVGSRRLTKEVAGPLADLCAAELPPHVSDNEIQVLSIAGSAYEVGLMPSPRSRRGALIVWQLQEPLNRVQLEALYGLVQRCAKWLSRLESTEELLYRDDLTGLYNHRYLEVSLDAELRRAERFGGQFCILFIDLDHFKPINDQHGHLAGSQVLKQVAGLVKESIREVDTAIRYGGDEFVVVLLGATQNTGRLAAERIRKALASTNFSLPDHQTATLSASIGLAAYPDHGASRDELLRLADRTMYQSKKQGRNRVTVVTPERKRHTTDLINQLKARRNA